MHIGHWNIVEVHKNRTILKLFQLMFSFLPSVCEGSHYFCAQSLCRKVLLNRNINVAIAPGHQWVAVYTYCSAARKSCVSRTFIAINDLFIVWFCFYWQKANGGTGTYFVFKFDLIVLLELLLSQLQIIQNNNLLIVLVVCSETHNVTRQWCWLAQSLKTRNGKRISNSATFSAFEK